MKGLVAGVLVVVSLSTAVLGEEMEVTGALNLFPEGEDVAIAYDENGRLALEAAIEVIERELGVSSLFDYTDEEAYAVLEIPLDRKRWVSALSQGYYTLADLFLDEDSEAKAAFGRGQFWGLKSLRMARSFATVETRRGFIDAVAQETDVAALYWTYGNWARKDEYDPLGAIFRNDPPKLLGLIERALELDETYMAYGAYRALAAFWGGLPPMPLIEFGQKLPRALSYICPVLDESAFCMNCAVCPVDPNVGEYFENRRIFAEYYLMEKGLWDHAARVLRSILDEPSDYDHPLYNAYCRRRAQELLHRVEERL